jgi:hypothetical protein
MGKKNFFSSVPLPFPIELSELEFDLQKMVEKAFPAYIGMPVWLVGPRVEGFGIRMPMLFHDDRELPNDDEDLGIKIVGFVITSKKTNHRRLYSPPFCKDDTLEDALDEYFHDPCSATYYSPSGVLCCGKVSIANQEYDGIFFYPLPHYSRYMHGITPVSKALVKKENFVFDREAGLVM